MMCQQSVSCRLTLGALMCRYTVYRPAMAIRRESDTCQHLSSVSVTGSSSRRRHCSQWDCAAVTSGLLRASTDLGLSPISRCQPGREPCTPTRNLRAILRSHSDASQSRRSGWREALPVGVWLHHRTPTSRASLSEPRNWSTHMPTHDLDAIVALCDAIVASIEARQQLATLCEVSQ